MCFKKITSRVSSLWKKNNYPTSTVDVPSPRDLILQSDINYDPLKQLITIKNIKPPIWLTTVQDTNSMDPIIDFTHTCILTKDFMHADLAIGDVVVYWNGESDVLHRIIKISEDTQGRKYTTRGDNTAIADPYVIRDIHLKWLLIGIIY